MLRRESYAGRGQRVPVYLRVYDISNGRVAVWSQLVLRRKIEGIWHTGIHVFGFEYFYGGGINCMTSSQVETSFDMDIVETRLLGQTQRTRAEFERYLLHLYEKFTPETYDLIKWNCNHFSDTCARFLLENNGIPTSILNLPYIVGSTFLGNVALKVFQRVSQGHNPTGFSPDDPNHPRHEFFPNTNDTIADGKENHFSSKSVPVLIPCCGINYFSEDDEDFVDDDDSSEKSEVQRKQSTGSITTMTSPNDASNMHDAAISNVTLSEYSNVCPTLHEQTWIEEPRTDKSAAAKKVVTPNTLAATSANFPSDNTPNEGKNANNNRVFLNSSKNDFKQQQLMSNPLLTQQQSSPISNKKNNLNHPNINSENIDNDKSRQSANAKTKSNKIFAPNVASSDLSSKKVSGKPAKWDQLIDGKSIRTATAPPSEFVSVYLSERQKIQPPVIFGASTLLANKSLTENEKFGLSQDCATSRASNTRKMSATLISTSVKTEKNNTFLQTNKETRTENQKAREQKTGLKKEIDAPPPRTGTSSNKLIEERKLQPDSFPNIFGTIDDFLKRPLKNPNSKREVVACPECGAMSKSTDLMCRECGLDFMLVTPVAVIY